MAMATSGGSWYLLSSPRHPDCSSSPYLHGRCRRLWWVNEAFSPTAPPHSQYLHYSCSRAAESPAPIRVLLSAVVGKGMAEESVTGRLVGPLWDDRQALSYLHLLRAIRVKGRDIDQNRMEHGKIELYLGRKEVKFTPHRKKSHIYTKGIKNVKKNE